MINDVVKKIIPLFKTNIFVETGFQVGKTYEEISNFFPLLQMYEVDIRTPNIGSIKSKRPNSSPQTIFEGSESVPFLKKYLNEFEKEDNTLFFLDAHTSDESPLLEEIEVLLNLNNKPILCIDDFKTPICENGKFKFDKYPNFVNEFRWDKYGDHECSFEWIRHLIKDRTDSIFYCPKPSKFNSSGKRKAHKGVGTGMGIVFLDRYEKDFDILKGLPLLKFNFVKGEYKYL